VFLFSTSDINGGELDNRYLLHDFDKKIDYIAN
jgi:hypothetical protein